MLVEALPSLHDTETESERIDAEAPKLFHDLIQAISHNPSFLEHTHGVLFFKQKTRQRAIFPHNRNWIKVGFDAPDTSLANASIMLEIKDPSNEKSLTMAEIINKPTKKSVSFQNGSETHINTQQTIDEVRKLIKDIAL